MRLTVIEHDLKVAVKGQPTSQSKQFKCLEVWARSKGLVH